MHTRARRRTAGAGADSALYTSDSDTDTSQKSKFNNSNYLLRICRGSAPAIRATPATMQFIIRNDAKLSKLTPAQPVTAIRSGGFSSRETHRTQPALKTTNPARPWARGRPQRGGEADETPAPADWQPTPNRRIAPTISALVCGPRSIGSPVNRTAATFPGARCRPPSSRADHMRAMRGSPPRATASLRHSKKATRRASGRSSSERGSGGAG